MENSFHSKGSKNFILKSDYINNNSLHGSKKNLSSFVDINNNQNQKSLFFEQEEENFKKDKINQHGYDKDINSNFFTPGIFNENEHNLWNKNRNNHNNMIQEYFCQNVEDNMESFNNQFNNMNLSNNEINENTEKNNNYININYFNSLSPAPHSQNSLNSPNNENMNINLNYGSYNNSLKETNTNSNNNTSEQNNNNNMNQNNFININPVLINQNNFNRRLILSPYNNNNTNGNNNPNIYFQPEIQNNPLYQQQNPNLNNMKNGDIPLALLKNRDENLINNCVTLCKEQIECRLLQKKIDEDPSLASNVIYEKIKDKVQEISCDQFGNYFMQKVIENLNFDQVKELLIKKI